jgi:epsin
MPMIYKRFTEKTAEEWRQIYKVSRRPVMIPLTCLIQSQALQLLEFLIKNGSERVIDDVRSHLSLIKMLRQFHYIDPNGKDQGINVRNRSKELTELLGDVDKIRSERKKARQNKNKYGGVEGGASLGEGMSSTSGGSRYGGFGSESASGGYGGATRQVYGDGGGFGGETVQDDWEERSQSRSRGADRFDEYDEYDQGSAAPPRRKPESSRSGTKTSTAKKPEPPKPKEPEVDLFDFGDEPVSLSTPAVMPTMSLSSGKQPANDGFGALQSGGADDDDDDFDDFQSAPAAAATAPKPNYTPNYTSVAPPLSAATPNTQFAQPQPRPGINNAAFSTLFSTTSPVTGAAAAPPAQSIASPMSSAAQPRAGGFQAAQPNYYTSVSAKPSQPASTVTSPGIRSPIGGAPKPKASGGGDAFAALLSGTSVKKSGTPGNKGPTMADMAKQKASAGIWGTTSTSTPSSPAAPQNGGQRSGGAMDDLLG